MPLQATSGAASYDAFGGGVAAVPTYIEDVFSTYLYTGTSADRSISNGIDLAGKGGLVWIKNRTPNAESHNLFDTARGALKYLFSNLTNAQSTGTNGVSAFNADGFSLLGASGSNNYLNSTYASWTFRKQPKFFDVVTFSGDDVNGRQISHNLGSAPGFIVIKSTNAVDNWAVWQRTLGDNGLRLNGTDAVGGSPSPLYYPYDSSVVTATTVKLNGVVSNVSGNSYVAYLFAHNAGGFGLTGTDNVITCDSFTTDASGYADVNLGYEPQWILMKASSAAGAGENWITVDNMRGLLGTGTDYKAARLYPNLSNAEASLNTCQISSTGFKAFQSTSVTYIYIAIRRGPMKVPTDATKVFGANARSGTGANATVTGGQTDDAVLIKNRGSAVADLFSSRLTGTGYLVTSSTAAEVAAGTTILQANPWDVMDGVKVGTTSTITNASGNTFVNYLFKRAPNFFDEVCYTGTGANTTVTHNLSVVPELMIVKSRSLGTESWTVWNTTIAALNAANFLWLNSTSNVITNSGRFNSTSPTSSVFTVGSDTSTNGSGSTYVAYLFATCPNVSKVGSYTGNGSSQTINCGFTGGARFVLIKRTDSTGDWYVWDTARGIVTANDPHLSLNTTAAEVTTDDTIDPDNTGFIVNQLAATNVNVTSATYIFLAIA